MVEWIKKVIPNVYIYRKDFITNTLATLEMFIISGIIAFIIGLFVGILLTITKKGGIKQNRIIFHFLDIIINILRSIPFIILIIFLIPITRKLVGTAIGITGAIFPLVVGTVPFFARQVETTLANVSDGKLEAARSMGCSTIGLIFRVYLKEAVPELIRVTTITAISLIGLIAMAGAVGAGGLGDFAMSNGYAMHHTDIVNVCVIVLLIIVCIIQAIGSLLSKKTVNRELFRKKVL